MTDRCADAFLRAAYLVFDWDDPAIYVADGSDCDKPDVNVTSLSDYDALGCHEISAGSNNESLRPTTSRCIR